MAAITPHITAESAIRCPNCPIRPFDAVVSELQWRVANPVWLRSNRKPARRLQGGEPESLNLSA